LSGTTVLLISSDPSLIQAVRGVIRSVAGLRLETAASLPSACSLLERRDVVLLLPHLLAENDTGEIKHLLRALVSARSPVATLVVSDHYQAEQNLELQQFGATDYLRRPLDLGRLKFLMDVYTVRARYQARQAVAVPAGGAPKDGLDPFQDLTKALVGPVIDLIKRVAPQQTTLLFTGETGVGKTYLARCVHEMSPRQKEPLLAVNCAALSPSLMESELFGHVKGAFTGADRDRTGKFAEAGRGTLLLDEIDALPLELQAKLLRVVDERVFEPVGSNRTLRMQARLIIASNRALDQEVDAGRFRADLYYRLNVVSFYLPPLRERPQVIPALIERFLGEFIERDGRPIEGIAHEAMEALETYSWPGNIRELRNAVERAVALCPEPLIQLADLPEALRASAPAVDVSPPVAPPRIAEGTLSRTKEEAEARRIAEVLNRNGNNRLQAAVELGISRMTLYKKMHRYGMMAAGAG
jgi:two-component system, NtrC family, response regulator HydG